MRYLKLDMNMLVVLDALLADPHVTRAARRLSVTQPSLSGSLARLREYFEDELIVRAGPRMELTPLAKELREPVRDLMARAERVLAMRSGFDPQTSDRCFTLSCNDYVWATFVRHLVARLRVEAPRVRIEYAGNRRDFEERRTELLIVADRFVMPTLPSLTLFEDPMVCIVSARSPLRALTEADYFAAQHVVAYSARLMDDWIDRHCDRRRQVAVRVPSYTLIPQVIVDSPYVATVPLVLARTYASLLPLRLVAPPLPFPPLVLALQWHRHQASDAGLRWFRDVIFESAQHLGAPFTPMPADASVRKGAPRAPRRKRP